VVRRFAVAVAVLAALVAAPSAVSGGNPGFFVGFADDLPKEVGADAVTPATALGASAFRFTLQWSPGQAAVSAADAAKLDRAVAAAAGSRIVLAVYGTTADAAPTDATRRDQYCGYVRDALARYPSIRDVVVWNEPNKSQFWRPQLAADGSVASPSAYEALLAQCWDVLHTAFPGVNVLGFALAHNGNDDAGSRSPGDFIRRVGDAYRASGRSAPVVDTVAFHPYPSNSAERPWRKHIGSKEIDQGDWNKLMYNLWLAFHGTGQPIPGEGGVTIWYTEVGFQTAVPPEKASVYTGTENVAVTVPAWTGGEPESPAPAETSAAPDQGTQALDAIRLASCQPFVGAFFNFLLADEPILVGWQSGPLWADRTPKGSWDAFHQAIAAATGGAVDCDALKGGRPSADFMPPTAPEGLSGTAATGPAHVDLSWSASTDDASALSYRVYRGGTWVGTTSETTWTNVSVAEGKTYTYTVRALDAAGNLGDASTSVTVSVPDVTAPSAPASLSAAAATNPGRVELSWPAASDNVGVTAYEVSRDGTLLGSSSGTTYSDGTVTGAQTYTYAVVALDAAGNRSEPVTATLTTPDLAPPSAPATVTARAADGPPRVDLTWTAASDDVGVTAYDVLRDGVLAATVTATSWQDTAVAATQSHTYAVRARDAAGNAGASVSVTVTVPDQTAPSVPIGLNGTAYRSPTRVVLSWSQSADNVRVAGYRVYRNGTLVATTSSTTFTDAYLARWTTYRYTVAAYDAAGNCSAQSATLSVTTGR
jgi:fibronectin type 3 domain-containing protein